MPEVKINELAIHYELDDFTDPWVKAESIWIQHGFGRSGKFWYHWVPPLSRKYRVLRVDMRGHGRSADPPIDHAWSVDELLSDIRGVIEALKLGSVHYVGESVGGILGIALAARWPELLKSLTLVAAPLSIRPEIQDIFAVGEKDWPTAMEKLGGDGWVRGLMGYGATHSDTTRAKEEWILSEWAKNRPKMLANLARLAATVNVESLLPEVNVPTLILAPAKSPISPLEEQLKMRRAIPNARIVTIEGAWHEIYFDDPEACVSALLNFLSSLSHAHG
ncbi:MAG: alpha/beta hydrolase [Candidatus Abyssobacteria bacterium SURF_17]|uniref:Alpha/beta hydrolase n=1 Tax=Candidatus Abyssobacteria bacterium SURF_17 TaxID=2093361 RepID=A0A419EP58_9BACT|nr:MAG: alpha/beta hydrolase [Candidatus Abyssubacteria bacterium SURF_17]